MFPYSVRHLKSQVGKQPLSRIKPACTADKEIRPRAPEPSGLLP